MAMALALMMTPLRVTDDPAPVPLVVMEPPVTVMTPPAVANRPAFSPAKLLLSCEEVPPLVLMVGVARSREPLLVTHTPDVSVAVAV
jgi:hypothetical protein